MSDNQISFPLFFMIWAQEQQWNVPAFHIEILQFLDKIDDWDNATAVLQVFRGAGKSSILALMIVYSLVKNPTLRFLILSADNLTAKRITEDCLSIINRHPLAANLKGKEQTWQKHRFSVRGSTDARNPSVAAHGIMSNITSARADIAIFDDVEVPKNCDSEEKRDQLRRRMSEITHILIPETGRRLIVGTPHTFNSIYPETIKNGCSSLMIPLIENPEGEFPYITGDSRWGDRFTNDVIAQRQLQSKSKAEFLSQYQLQPTNVFESILDSSKIKIYDTEVTYGWGNKQATAMLGDIHLTSVSVFWDVALSKARGDDSVLAIVYSDDKGNYYIHRTVELNGGVEDQCEQIRDIAIDLNLPVIIVETNGIGGFVPQILLNAVREHGIGVDGRATTVNKQLKIIEGLETPISGGFLYMHKSVANSKFVPQVRDFHPKNLKDRDDYIDAVASAILNEPMRIGKRVSVGNNPITRWNTHQSSIDVQVDSFSL